MSLVEREQNFLNRCIQAIQRVFDTLEERLKTVDYRGQIKPLELQDKTCRLARDSPYFGVFEVPNPETGAVEVFRIGRNAPIWDESEVIVHSYFGDFGQRYSQEDVGPDSKLTFKAEVVMANDIVLEVRESRSSQDQARRKKLLKPKTESLSDIVESIRPEQDVLVRYSVERPLIVEGGPGTGKTVVGLQRLAYLVIAAADALIDKRVAVVGPSTAYVEYVKNFLPELGIELADHFEILDLCRSSVDDTDLQHLQIIRKESAEMVMEKNKPLLDVIIRHAVWGKVQSVNFEAKISAPLGAIRQRFISAEDVGVLLERIRNSFDKGEASYESARNELALKIQEILLQSDSEVVTAIGSGRTFIERRDLRLDRWLLKIGLHSQAKRAEWAKQLKTPAGNRIRREFEVVMNDFYSKDIDRAIEMIAELCTMEPSVLKAKLKEINAPSRRSGEPDDDETAEILTGVTQKIDDISSADITKLEAGRILVQIEAAIERIMPKKETLRVAELVCTGTDDAFTTAHGSQGRAIGRKFNESARMNGIGLYKYEWSDADLPIVSEVAYALHGRKNDYFHIMVDEAQDLTRMQCRVVSRIGRSGQFTLLGDPNQATSVAALADWDGLLQAMGSKDAAKFTLEHNYRVPQNIFDYAAMYLPEDVRVSLPTCDLDGGELKTVVSTNFDDSINLMRQALDSRNKMERWAVISEDDSLADSLEESENIIFLSPASSKGLEVDHVLIFEPGDWFDAGASSKRLMYVALTRATKSVVVIQHNPESFAILETNSAIEV
jgi:hypothetical protein